MTDINDYVVGFAPNQTLPPGYRVEWWESDEMFRWVIDENTYSIPSWDRFRARRMAWKHYRARRGDDG